MNINQEEVDMHGGVIMAGNNTVFSTTLQSLRKKKGVTQEQLANHLGVSAQAVSKWENGSYPEGDLLPKISEFFGVSISYLYGQETEKKSIEQEVLDCLKGILNDGKETQNKSLTDKKYFDKFLDILWAFQMGVWRNNNYYYERGEVDKETRTASVLTSDAGFSYFNLNKERQFVTIVREPEDGFTKNLEISQELRDFFALLGKPGALEILLYMLSLSGGEYVTSSTIAKMTHMSQNEVDELLEEAEKFMRNYNACFRNIELIHADKVERAFGIDPSSVEMYIALILTANVIIKPPYGYQMQISTRDKAWLKRDEVQELLKEKIK